jgi:hypothetical protein
MQANLPTTQSRPGASAWHWLAPLLGMLLIGIYFSARFGGQWAESDTATFAQFTREIVASGQLVPSGEAAYPNGFAFQAISAMLVALTGADVVALQQVIYPLLAALVVLPAWLTYRELTGSARGASLATALLLTQPEFLFVMLRSSHEKITRTLMLLCLFWLVRSFKLRDQPWQFAAHVALFYITAFAFIASNNLLAHSFIVAVATALLCGWLIERRSGAGAKPDRLTQRLRYAVAVCLGLVYVFTFYAYPPAQHDLLVLQSVGQRIAALLLDVQTHTTNSYAQIETGWVNLPVYFLVSLANWLLLAGSFAIWARQGWRWLRHRAAPATQEARLLWLFYGAFAFQGGLSIVADASGALGSNLQHRLFPSFSIVAVALVGAALASWRPARLPRWGLVAAIGCVSLLSVLKATNEPLLSNKWTFYRQDELAALRWSDAHLTDATVWSEFDERLSVAFLTTQGESANRNRFVGYGFDPGTRSLLVSDTTRMRGGRLGRALPLPWDALQVYDDGLTQLFHLRPLSQYQK